MFTKLSLYPPVIKEDKITFQYALLTCYAVDIDSVRIGMLARKKKSNDTITPTSAVLVQHNFSVLPTKQVASGPRYSTLKWNKKSHPSGDGSSRITCGRFLVHTFTICRELPTNNKMWLQDLMYM